MSDLKSQGCETAMVLYARAGIQLAATNYEPLESQPKHCHETASITLVLAGDVEESIRSGTRTGGVCSVLVKPAGVYHADRYGPRAVKTFQILLHPDRMREIMPTLAYGWHDGGPAARAMIDLLRTARNHLFDHEDALDTALSDVFATVHADHRACSTGRAAWIADLKARIDDCPNDSVSVQAVAESHGLHPVSVARAFRRHVGCSITGYVRRRRILQACRLMESCEHNLAEIALQAGFSDQAHLTRMFRRELGVPPGRFRDITA